MEKKKGCLALQIKSSYILFLLIFLSFQSFTQIIFEEGYFIDNDNKKTECLIKNYDWKNSPTKIEYRLNESSESITAGVELIKELSVGKHKYQRFTVNIDQSSDVISNLSTDKDPVFVEETVFLRLIIEGNANLYEYGNKKRYFYSVNNSDVLQLIYKDYLLENRVFTNNSFRSQLWEDLKCPGITLEEIKNINFYKRDLVKIFEKYNTCVESEFINHDKNKKRVAFNLYIKPGLRRATLSIRNSQNSAFDIDFGGSISFSVGIETELVLPFNKNKWSVIFEPTYQYYKAKDPRAYFDNTADYKSVELPLGIRYYMYLNRNSKIFLSAAVVLLDIPINSTIGRFLEINSTNNLNFGIGYNYKNKFSAELRYGSQRRLLTKYVFYSSNYQSVSLILGYNFL